MDYQAPAKQPTCVTWIGKIKKGCLCFAQYRGDITSPDFYPAAGREPQQRADHRNAENVIMDRKLNNSGSVSEPAQYLGWTARRFSECTADLHLQQSAHPGRPGADAERRLIAKYEFGKLGTEKREN